MRKIVFLQRTPRLHRVWHTLVRKKYIVILIMCILVACGGAGGYLIYENEPPPTPTKVMPASPYGFTVYEQFRPQTVTYLKQLHVEWIRYQLNWQTIEPEPGHYNWSQLDAAVRLANANGIAMTFPLQGAPQWALSQVCAKRHFLPGAEEMATFAMIVAQRYNGLSGHGVINAYEIGNEEFDSLWTGNYDESVACRQPTFYGPVLKAAYQAIKRVDPQALVGMCSLWWVNTTHVSDYINWLYANHYGSDFDFANFHYYICNRDPAYPSLTRPSLVGEAAAIQRVMNSYGDGKKAIWLTETGWNINGVDQDPACAVSPQIQANYLVETAQLAKSSHMITSIFWYTIDRGDDGMSITQPGGVTPAFNALKDFIHANPTWSS